MDGDAIHFQAADVAKEEKRQRTLEPLPEILLDLLLEGRVSNRHLNPGDALIRQGCAEPSRFGKMAAVKSDGKRRCVQLDRVAEAEGALEADPSKPDGGQPAVF